MKTKRQAVRERACRREECAAWKALALRRATQIHNLGVDGAEADATRQTLLEHAGLLAERLHGANRARDLLAREAGQLRAELLVERGRCDGFREALTAAADKVAALNATVRQLRTSNAGLRDKVAAVIEERDAAREALDRAAEALGSLQAAFNAGAEENRLLGLSARSAGAEADRQRALVGEVRKENAALAEQARRPLHFIPVEGTPLPNGDWVFRLPKPRYSNALERRWGHIAAARVRARLRVDGAAPIPSPAPPVLGANAATLVRSTRGH
jgi:chromosome segregation ATPase